MTDSQETPKEEVTEEKVELTESQKQVAGWMNYVHNEVNTLLSMFLPFSKSASVGVLYSKAVTAVHESGPEYHPTKAQGVEVRIVFDFENVQEIPKEPEE